MRAGALIAALLACTACGKKPVEWSEVPPAPPPSAAPQPTVPPVMPPEEPPVSAAPSASAPTPVPAIGSEFERASQAALNGNHGAVRSLLWPKVKSGRGTPDERRLLRAACKAMHDVDCVNDTK